MSRFIKEEYINENDYTFLYQYHSENECRAKIEEVMLNRGYRHIGSDVYEKGNGTLRLFIGAFHKHYKYEIMPEMVAEDQVRISIRKRSTGFAGGAIGVNQIQKELAALKQLFLAI